MKDLENKLNEMKIPRIESEEFEQSLRRELIKKYHNPAEKYKLKFRYASAFACLLLVFGCTTILKPDLALKINNIAFNKTEVIVCEDEVNCNELEKFRYTSINSPELESRIDPDKFKEDKAYVIRKYTSSEEGGLMIVSEFDRKKQQKKSAKRISF
ncbi:MAG: hypothetical protein B1H06_06245 [Candidatus Cloacimonas sp. 4484_143]|nr:MAG: hypothetical protein B1H06_06245 [Candidatus Cloacimonas sp. 4484_143]RLC53420.1 MAG: hypothetical protein DRI23_00310 [Candidatus Cloacimonadota bacterium]RLC54073.1 MAG: hypothetical protein DRH79_01755 [Candidatus Cloacimonadota bacterium]